MLHLYDFNKTMVEGLVNYKDYKIESVLNTGDKTLSFLYPSNLSENIFEEYYIRNKTDEFVIKEIKDDGKWKSVVAVMNVEDLEGKAWTHFDCTEQTIEKCLTLAVAGTGWSIKKIGTINKKRTVRKANCSTWDLIQEAKKVYRVELEFDTLNRIVNVHEKMGYKKGTYFIDSLNLKELEVEANSYDYYTNLLAIGKDDIKVLVENYQYSNKVKTLIWKDEKYTDKDSLTEDAILKLKELSKPYKSYRANIIDLARISDDYRNILDYKLGDVIILISKDLKVKEEQRIVKIVEYPDNPMKNDCEMANTTLTFKELQKEFIDSSKTVSNITEDNGKISEKAIKDAVNQITVNKADIDSLNAAEARIGTLETTTAKITQLDSINANIIQLQSSKANITDLTADNIKVNVIEGNTANLQTILSKFISGENGQILHLTSQNVLIDNAVIKDAMIDAINVNKLLAGDISTNKFRIKSDDGGIEIIGATQQFKDKNNKVRIQMGQDTIGNFNFILRGEDGTTTLIDHTGIKEKAIADKLIKSNMVADNAIGEQQINYSSFVTGLNKDTNTQLIKASKVAIDLTGQSLEVSFNSLKSNVDNIEIGGRNLQLNADFNKPLSESWRYATQNMSISEDMLCDGYKSVKILRTNATTATNTIYLYTGAVIPAKYNDEFTMSFMYYIPEILAQEIDGSFYAGVYFYKDQGASAGSKRIDLSKKIVKGNWTRVVVTGKATDVDTLSVAFVVGFNKNCEVYISKPKLERGNKATDFILAPEDTDEKIEANTTAISIAQGKIEGIISESSITKGDVTALKNNYTNIKATLDGINTTVASHTSSIGNLTTDLSGVSGKVATVENKQAFLEQNLNGFKTTVASTYSTKTELSTVDGKVTALTSRVSTAESSITQLNNSIDLNVSNLKKIVQEGNNNLVSNSNWFKGPSGWRLSTTLAGNYFYGVSGSIALEDKYYVRLGHINNNETSSIYADSSKFPVSPGGKITYGAFGAVTSNVRLRIYLLFTSNTGDINTDNSFMSGYTSILYEGNAAYTKKNLTVTVPDGAIRAFIRVRIDKIDTSINTDSSGVFSSLMVRKGEEVFEWCPSQGDSYTYIDEQTAKLQVNINDITSRVSSTESTISTINGNVSSLQSRMSTAEQKITADAIVSTVRSSTAYTSDLNNKANQSALNTTNNNVSGLTNKVNTVEQKITPTAITTTISSAITGGTGSISTTQFIMDKNGLLIKNGALTIQNNSGTKIFYTDTSGNITFTGKLQPSDYQIRLFGNDCKIDGSAGAIRMQWNAQNYVSVENGALRMYNSNSASGTRYISFATDTEGHANIWGTQTRMKLLGNSSARPVIQSRNISDNAYGDFHGADFLNRSTIKDKTNVQDINDIDFKKLLMENTIKKYNLKTDVETVLDVFGLENPVDDVVGSSADTRLGFILEELTQDARAMLSPGNMESISIYSMCSILWKVCQEQQKRIEALENLQ